MLRSENAKIGKMKKMAGDYYFLRTLLKQNMARDIIKDHERIINIHPPVFIKKLLNGKSSSCVFARLS